MKRNKLISLITVLALVLSMLSLYSAAATTVSQEVFVVDEAGVFTQDELLILEQKAQYIYDNYGERAYFTAITNSEGKGEESLYYAYDVVLEERGLDYTDTDVHFHVMSAEEYDAFYYKYGGNNDVVSSAVMDYHFDYLVTGDYFNYASGYFDAIDSYHIGQAAAFGAIQQQLDNLTVASVMDMADLLTPEEEQKLAAQALEIEEKHGVAAYVVTIEDFTAILDTWDVFEAATKFYTDYNLGYGEDKEGVLLMLSIDARDHSYIRYGPKTEDVFTNSMMIDIENKFLNEFADDYWYYGFHDYLSDTDAALTFGFLPKIGFIIIALAVGIALAAFIGYGYYSVLSNLKKKAKAHDYIPSGGVDIRVQNDVFTHTTTTRTRRSSDSGGGGGGGRSSSGGGFSGRSGKF